MRYQSYVFYVEGMTCGACTGSLNKMLSSAYKIKTDSFNADLTSKNPKKKTTVQIEDDGRSPAVVWHEIAAKIRDMGYDCEDINYHPLQKPPLNTTEIQPLKQNTLSDELKTIVHSHWFLGGLGCITGIALLISSFFLGGMPLIGMIAIGAISTLLTLALGARSYYDAYKKLVKSGTLTMDSLFTISTLSVLAVSIAAFFVPWLPMMFEVGLLIFGFKHLGLAIEETIKEQINYKTFQDYAPKTVQKCMKDGLHNTAVVDICANDVILINPGELIPLDGFCVEKCSLYETITTGWTLPRDFSKDEGVLAGMRAAEDAPALKIRVTRDFDHSYLAKLDARIEQSLLEKAPIELKTNTILTYFIPAIMTIAIAAAVLIGFFFPPALAIQCAVSVLVCACPCTLGLIVPLAVKTGIHKAAENGVLFKNAKALQTAAEIDVVVIDLHGTLTTGIPIVSSYEVLQNSGISRQELLNCAYSLEQQSKHPIAKALYAYAHSNNARLSEVLFEEKTHHAGISGIIDMEYYTIGSASLMREYGISTDSIENQLTLAAGDSVVYVARGQNIQGYFIMTQALRKDAKATIEELKKLGKEVHLCTGADEQTAQRYAQLLGINQVHAECVGASLVEGDKSKPAYIQSLIDKGHKVAMIGDGANDALAITISDFGIAVASHDSDDITQQQAGAVIQSNCLLSIVSAFTIAGQTVNNINQNLLISLLYNSSSILISGGLLLAVGIALNPALGAALMGIQACIVLLNVYYFKVQPLPHLETKTEPADEDALDEGTSHHQITQLLPNISNNLIAQTLNEEDYHHPSNTLFDHGLQNITHSVIQNENHNTDIPQPLLSQ